MDGHTSSLSTSAGVCGLSVTKRGGPGEKEGAPCGGPCGGPSDDVLENIIVASSSVEHWCPPLCQLKSGRFPTS